MAALEQHHAGDRAAEVPAVVNTRHPESTGVDDRSAVDLDDTFGAESHPTVGTEEGPARMAGGPPDAPPRWLAFTASSPSGPASTSRSLSR